MVKEMREIWVLKGYSFNMHYSFPVVTWPKKSGEGELTFFW